MTDYSIGDVILREKPLIHCITNPISINQCANAILALGARPIMAEHPKEVGEITGASDALMLNIGNITDARMESMLISVEEAKRKNIPVLLDVVGVACSRFRREYVKDLLKAKIPSVIKGNYSEIEALNNAQYFSSGVDAEALLDVCQVTQTAKDLALAYGTIILATGETDIITDGKRVVYIKNGTRQLASVTGTGCMLGSLCATFMTAASPMDASVIACCYLGICGELAETEKGNGTFMINLMDKISTLERYDILKYLNMEER